MENRFILFTALCVICLSGCHKVGDKIIPFEGPTTLSSEAQTVTYTPTKNVTTTIYDVWYALTVKDTGASVESDSQSVNGGSDFYKFDFFTITVNGGDITLNIDENLSDYKRRINISYYCSSKSTTYDPYGITITQLPQGQ